MGKLIDLTGQKFGELTVLKRDNNKQACEAYWICQCSCGKIISTRGSVLRKGLSTSCGCQKDYLTKEKLSKDLTGQKFGELTVIKLDKDNQKKGAYWICQCSCGNIKSISASSLKDGKTKSCGCKTNVFISQSLSNEIKEGQIFGKWKVIKKDIDNTGKGARYICQCDCGVIKSVKAQSLLNGSSLSCGCLSSAGEWKITQILKQLKYQVKTQYIFKDLYGDSYPLRFDFAIFNNDNLLCLIEYQGEQHYHYKEFFEEHLSFKKRQEYNNKKRQYCKEKNIKLIEIPYWEYEKIDKDYLENLIK